MADQTVTNTNVVDLPEYVKPYYKMLLNGVSGITFAPNYVAAQLGSGSTPAVTTPTGTGQSTVDPNAYTQPAAAPIAQQPSPAASAAPMTQIASPAAMTMPGPNIQSQGVLPGGSSLQTAIDDILNGRLFGGNKQTEKMASGGQVTPDPMKQSLLGGNAYNTGIGAVRTIGDTGQVPISTGTPGQTVFLGPNGPTTSGTPMNLPTVAPNYAVQPFNVRNQVGLGQTPGSLWPAVGGVPQQGGEGAYHPPAGGGLPSIPPAGGGGFAAAPAVNAQKPDYAAANISTPGLNGMGPQDAARMGYNPDQYASADVANKIASQFGGTVATTGGSGGPNGPPPQNLVNIGGADTNAGLDQKFLEIFGPERGAEMIRQAAKGVGVPGMASGGKVKGKGANEDIDPQVIALKLLAQQGLYDVGRAGMPPKVGEIGIGSPYANVTTAGGHPLATVTGVEDPVNFNRMLRGGSGDNMLGDMLYSIAEHVKDKQREDYIKSQNFNKSPKGYAEGGLASLQTHFADGGGTWGGGDPGTGATPPATQTEQPNPSTPTGNGVFQPYQPYGGQRLLSSDPNADPTKTWKVSDRTAAAESGLSSLPSMFDSNGQLQGVLGDAEGMIRGGYEQTGNGLYGAWNIANNFNPQSQYQKPTYSASTFSPNSIDASKLQMGSAGTVQMDPLNLYQQQGPRNWTDPNVGSNYMDPYMRSVVDTQKQQAVQDFAESKQNRDAQAVRAGAFGGSRQAVADSLAHRDLQRQLAQIEATGDQSAYTNAQQQFNADRSAGQAAATNNLQAALQTQGLNTNAQLQAALANQGTALNQYGQMYQGQLQAALANQGAGLTAQQLGEQSRQFGAGLENQGQQFADTQQLSAGELAQRIKLGALGMGIQAAGQQSNIGANTADLYRLGNQMQIQNLQQEQSAGAAEDARRQAQLNLGYQDFLNQKNYPYQQANFYSGILRGVPTTFNQDQVQISNTNYNPLTQALGLGLGALGTVKQGGATGGAITPEGVQPVTRGKTRSQAAKVKPVTLDMEKQDGAFRSKGIAAVRNKVA